MLIMDNDRDGGARCAVTRQKGWKVHIWDRSPVGHYKSVRVVGRRCVPNRTGGAARYRILVVRPRHALRDVTSHMWLQRAHPTIGADRDIADATLVQPRKRVGDQRPMCDRQQNPGHQRVEG